MKKLTFAIFFIMFLLGKVTAQTDIGITFSPLITINRFPNDADTLSFTNAGPGLRFKAGVLIDIPMSQNIAIGTGFLFVPQRVGIKAASSIGSRSYKEVYSLQYLNVPATVKLFTNDVALDTRLYFQGGGVVEILINDKEKLESNFMISDFRGFDFSTMLGMGIERRISASASLISGISYQRGLVNLVKDSSTAGKQFSLKKDLIALDLAIKF